MEQMTVNSYEELGLTKQDLGAMYETMVRARKIDERMWKLNLSLIHISEPTRRS